MSQYIPQRDADHVAAGSVASMFSPAAYLAKLWLEAKDLHPTGHLYALQTRRADLQNLMLNQENLDKPISTLTLSNELLANLCQTSGNFSSYAALLEAMSSYTASSGKGFHSPFETLRGVLKNLPDEPEIFTDTATANLLYSGIAPADRNSKTADEIARQGQIWRLTQFYDQTEENARVIAGLPLSETSSDTTESQFKRLFNGLEAAALIQMPAVEQRKVLMQAFGLNDNDMILLQSLEVWNGTTALNSVAAISGLYAWVLLSRALGCSLADLVLLKSVGNPANPWQRFDTYRKILLWLEKRQLTANDLFLMTTTNYPTESTPSMDSLIREVARNNGSTDEEMKKGLADAVSASLELTSPRRARALIDWLDTDIPSSEINSQRFLAAIMTPVTAPMVTYLNRLAQHALVMNNLQLTDDMLEMLARKPTIVPGGNTASFIWTRLQNLARLKSAVDLSGANGLALLNKLSSGTLTVSDLALYLNVNANLLTLDPTGTLLTFDSLISCLKNYELTQKTGISLPNLVSLRLLRGDSPYATWKSVAETLLAILPEEQVTQLKQQLSEKLSIALTNLLFSSSYNQYLIHNTRYVVIYVTPTQTTADIFEAMTLHINNGERRQATIYTSAGWNPAYPKENMLSILPDMAKSDRPLRVGDWIVVDLGKNEAINNLILEESYLQRYSDYTLFALPDGSLPTTINISTMPSYSALTALQTKSMVSWKKTPSDQNNLHTLNIGYNRLTNSLETLSDYLLIDPLMGGETQTSRLAWAIASIQQYIIRCLNGEEPGVVSTVKDRQFFADWDRYNKRYSLWAGLTRLLYEPENWLDPALRLRKSEAFDNLQALLDSGQLNEESAEEAFLTYLTEFEQLSELEIVGAYHDVAEFFKGITWFLARTKGTPYRWYWRTLDHSKLTAGAIQAQAWTGWTKIDLPINLVGNLIKPLVYNSRLHLIWLERQDKTTRNSSGTDVPAADCTLKVAYRRYDGSWSMPSESLLTLTGEVNTAFSNKTTLNQLALFCTEDTLRKTMIVILNKAIQLPVNATKAQGWLVRSDARTSNLSDLSTVLGNCSSIIDYPSIDFTYISVPYNGSNVSVSIRVNGKGQSPQSMVLPGQSVYLSSDVPAKLRDIAAKGIDGLFTLKGMRDAVVNVYKADINQVMDLLNFRGSQGIYYWELFYHAPLLISQSLRDKQDYIAALYWTKCIFNAGGFSPATNGIRYIMLRRGNSNCFDVAELEAYEGTSNVAQGKPVTVGPQGDHPDGRKEKAVDGNASTFYAAAGPDDNPNNSRSWLQIDLQAVKSITSIKIYPRSSFLGRINNCHIYVSTEDMTDWANNSMAGDIDPRYPLVGITSYKDDISTAQTFNLDLQTRFWNPVPLQQDEAWDTLGSDITDPDLIAETDPMHYKLASFMQYLTLLISRSDTAYRQLEPDTLVEAQMGYQQALDALGEEPAPTPPTSWTAPKLKDITDIKIFRPQENEKLSGYWQLLRQRLYNLRHNLTIDGLARGLVLYATPADPQSLLAAAAASTSGMDTLPSTILASLRFQPALERARELAVQLSQFGSSLQAIADRQDGEAMNQLLQNQNRQLLDISQQMQENILSELDLEQRSLNTQRDNIQLRRDYYSRVYDENISSSEQSALALNTAAAAMQIAGGASHMVGGVLDSSVPNIYGVAMGGNRWGAVAYGVGSLLSNTASSLSLTASVLTGTDAYRRRREEYKLQLDSAENELKQLDVQQDGLKIRRQAAVMQKNYVLTQQRQTNDQLQLLQAKFSSQQLFGWMRSRLSTLFWQFYDLTVTASLRAEAARRWEVADSKRFIRPGAWQASYGGFLCGEALMLDLARMEADWQNWNKRALEVSRTISLSQALLNCTADNASGPTTISAAITNLTNTSSGSLTYSWTYKGGSGLKHSIGIDDAGNLSCQINLAALNIAANYPDSLGRTRRVKNISVSLPALLSPYQDIQAILSYSETGLTLPSGCDKVALSHGVNDSGLFQLDFNDPRYLPFEGINIVAPTSNSRGMLSLQFPRTRGDQKGLLRSLNDIILHIRYSIRD